MWSKRFGGPAPNSEGCTMQLNQAGERTALICSVGREHRTVHGQADFRWTRRSYSHWNMTSSKKVQDSEPCLAEALSKVLPPSGAVIPAKELARGDWSLLSHFQQVLQKPVIHCTAPICPVKSNCEREELREGSSCHVLHETQEVFSDYEWKSNSQKLCRLLHIQADIVEQYSSHKGLFI